MKFTRWNETHMDEENNNVSMWSVSNESVAFIYYVSLRKWYPLPVHTGNGIDTRARPTVPLFE